MTQIGPFFYIHGKLIYNACPLSEGREQAGKLDNPYGHEQLYDSSFKDGDYIDYPRGRVIWDKINSHAIIYIDPCIQNQTVLDKKAGVFELEGYAVASDDHYHCKNCVGDLFN